MTHIPNRVVQPPLTIVWIDPPPSRSFNAGRVTRIAEQENAAWSPIADEMRGHIGRWAFLWEGPVSSGQHMAIKIRYGMIPCFAPGGDFEAVVRHLDQETCRLYARYMGDPL